LKKTRWLGFAATAGYELTYYIETEKEKGEGPKRVLIRSIIRTRRKNIGKDTEYTKDDPEYSVFFLSETEDIELVDQEPDILTDHIQGEEEAVQAT
jgi:hypothetical protein